MRFALIIRQRSFSQRQDYAVSPFSSGFASDTRACVHLLFIYFFFLLLLFSFSLRLANRLTFFLVYTIRKYIYVCIHTRVRCINARERVCARRRIHYAMRFNVRFRRIRPRNCEAALTSGRGREGEFVERVEGMYNNICVPPPAWRGVQVRGRRPRSLFGFSSRAAPITF